MNRRSLAWVAAIVMCAAVPGTAIVRGEDDRDRRKELER